ncbi:MAG: tryptophan--tRNA ligase [Candidatus Pacebacteria bacterium]|nr:tryptophan--tRNA ligase [Candidatus Paceibacterota bacterium]
MKIFSAVRPTGGIHIGNYLGAINQWISLQENNDCYFAIADLHAITTPYDQNTLKDKIFELAVTYLSLGIDPQKCAFFIQSKVREHTELAWLIGTIVPVGELQRMTQFKDKATQHKEYVNAGLLNYPILMAADILLYKSGGVPVGKDQKQHVEFARNAAEKFNKQFGECFPIPEPLIEEKQANIMSLKDPSKKMSKSGDQKGCINIFEEDDSIRKKIMSAETDTGSEIKYDLENKKGISNLLSIYSAFSKIEIPLIEKKYEGKKYAEFKSDLADLLISKLSEFKEKRYSYYKNPDLVYNMLEKGAEKARIEAKKTIEEVKQKMGL